MIIISSRENFDDPDNVSRVGHQIKEIDLTGNEQTAKDMSFGDLKEVVNRKRILVLVHGYNNEQFEVYDAYQIIESKIDELTPKPFDHVIGYSWPGGDRSLEWWQGKSRANSIARMFRLLLEYIASSCDSTDINIMSHSLGARVVLKALKETPRILVRDYYCTAPAVDNECLESGEEFNASIHACNRLFVFHSARDGVLRISYRVAEGDRALGLHGPEDKDFISNRAKTVYVANCKKRISKHGGYKRTNELYKYILDYQEKNPTKFKTL